MADIIQFTDLPTSLTDSLDPDTVEMMLDGLNAQAVRVAPCLGSSSPAPTVDQLNEAKLTLFSAITRWVNDGSSNLAPEAAAPRPSYRLWPSEINSLQDICKTDGTGLGTIRTERDGYRREHVVLAVDGSAPIILGADPDWY